MATGPANKIDSIEISPNGPVSDASSANEARAVGLAVVTGNADPASATAPKRELTAAFELFNKTSQQLSQSYEFLERRIAQLNIELAATRDARLKQLAETERLANRLTRLLSALPAGVVVLDGEGVVREYNPAAAELLGEPLMNTAWREVMARAFLPQPEDCYEIGLRSGRTVNIETRSLGAEPGQIVLIHDVTEAHEMQERLARHKRLSAMGEMAAALAHQVRTPLASATLCVSHLTRPALDGKKRVQFARRVQMAMRHLEKLVNDMLSFARGGAAAKEPIRVAELIRQLRLLCDPYVSAAGVCFEVVNRVPAEIVYGNRDALLGALQNLISNAIDAAGFGGRIDLGVDAVDGALEFSVRDNGPGIPETVQENIFRPFFTTRSNGTGLGLAVAQSVARSHGGGVLFESKPGCGTTFVFAVRRWVSDSARGLEEALLSRSV